MTEALNLARSLGDRQHEADLLWHLGIRRAEMGQRGEALSYGQAAVDLMQTLGKPQARVFAEHLDQYRLDVPKAGLSEASGKTTLGPAPTAAKAGQTPPAAAPSPPQPAVSYLRMALSAAKALTRFVGSGLKTVSSETLQERRQQCAACSYHTGLRCRICGCFINLKARLPHEECPVGKWPGDRKAGVRRAGRR